MEPEHIFSRVKVYIIVPENQVIAAVQLLATSDVNLAQVEARRDKFTQALSRDIGTSYVDIFQVHELHSQAFDALILKIATTKETNLAEKLALRKFLDTSVCNLATLRK